MFLRDPSRDVGAGGAIPQVDVDEGEAASRRGPQRGFRVSGDTGDLIARIHQDTFQVERDENLVFDDQRRFGHRPVHITPA